MQLSGSYAFVADQKTVWNLLMDPDAIARAIPGVQEMVAVDGEDSAWRAVAKVGVASVSGVYTGVIRMSEIEAPHQFRLTVSGEGQQSVIGGTALMTISYDIGLQQTTVHWEAEAEISGKLASVGQRVIKAAAGLLSRMFFKGLAQQLP